MHLKEIIVWCFGAILYMSIMYVQWGRKNNVPFSTLNIFLNNVQISIKIFLKVRIDHKFFCTWLEVSRSIFKGNINKYSFFQVFEKREKTTSDMKILNIFISLIHYFPNFSKTVKNIKSFILHYSKHDLDTIWLI